MAKSWKMVKNWKNGQKLEKWPKVGKMVKNWKNVGQILSFNYHQFFNFWRFFHFFTDTKTGYETPVWCWCYTKSTCPYFSQHWEGIDRLELTRQGAFENTKLANLIRKIHDRLVDKRNDDWQFWLVHRHRVANFYWTKILKFFLENFVKELF